MVGDNLSKALTMLSESKYIIVVPSGKKPKKGDSYPVGTKVYVNSTLYKKTSFTEKKATMARINDYNGGLAGEGKDCKSLEEYQHKYMSLQCVQKIVRDHPERGLFSLWDCDCRDYIYEKQCPCSVLCRHLDPSDEADIYKLIQELPKNKKPGRPSKETKRAEKEQLDRDDGTRKRGLVVVQGD